MWQVCMWLKTMAIYVTNLNHVIEGKMNHLWLTSHVTTSLVGHHLTTSFWMNGRPSCHLTIHPATTTNHLTMHLTGHLTSPILHGHSTDGPVFETTDLTKNLTQSSAGLHPTVEPRMHQHLTAHYLSQSRPHDQKHLTICLIAIPTPPHHTSHMTKELTAVANHSSRLSLRLDWLALDCFLVSTRHLSWMLLQTVTNSNTTNMYIHEPKTIWSIQGTRSWLDWIGPALQTTSSSAERHQHLASVPTWAVKAGFDEYHMTYWLSSLDLGLGF